MRVLIFGSNLEVLTNKLVHLELKICECHKAFDALQRFYDLSTLKVSSL